MNFRKAFQIAILGAAALAMGTGSASAVCSEFGGYAIFQCADLNYFEPAPFPIVFDAADAPTNVSGVFWQIGFGHGTNNTGTGSTGTGNAAFTNFNGNDMGIALLDLVEGASISGQMPSQSLCIRVANWGNSGVDGCCDNQRATAMPGGLIDDDILNPYYHVYYARAFSYPGYYSTIWQQDYPMAVLLKQEPEQEFFAAAAVATLNRGNTGGNGPCHPGAPGTNPAACDSRAGFYAFKDITNGLANPATGGNDVIPWQPTPRPRAACVAGCSGAGPRTIDFEWDPVVWAHDASQRPSANPGMGITDTANGVGVRDLIRKNTIDTVTGDPAWFGLIKHDLQVASVTPADVDGTGNVIPGGLVWTDLIPGIQQPMSPITGNPTGPVVVAGVSAPVDTCYRVKLRFGKDPIYEGTGVGQTTIANCRLGKCGDRGYEVASTSINAITCVGGPLVSEKAINVRADRAKGLITLSWDTTAELSMTGFRVVGINKKGNEKTLAEPTCKGCTDGVGYSYSVQLPKGSQKGGVDKLRLDVVGGTPSSTEVPLR